MATLIEILSDPDAGWTRRPPASEAAIQTLIADCDFALPPDYLTFLRYSNGGEGILCIDPGWFRICPAEEVIEYNRGYCVEKYLPGYFAIGSNGGDEMLAIRMRDGSPFPVYMVPFCPMSEGDSLEVAHDFAMFLMAIGRE